MQGAQTTTEIFEKTTPALEITNNKLSEISADAWKDMAQYLNTKHTDKIQIKQDPASGVLTFDDPFQQDCRQTFRLHCHAETFSP